jgi:hypothetical protein
MTRSMKTIQTIFEQSHFAIFPSFDHLVHHCQDTPARNRRCPQSGPFDVVSCYDYQNQHYYLHHVAILQERGRS